MVSHITDGVIKNQSSSNQSQDAITKLLAVSFHFRHSLTDDSVKRCIAEIPTSSNFFGRLEARRHHSALNFESSRISKYRHEDA